MKRYTWMLLFGILAFSCVLRIPLANAPLERDEGEYAYIAWQWIQGETPYAHTFDQKFPFVFVIYRFILRFVGETPAAIHWAMQGWVLLTLLAIFFVGRFCVSDEAGLIAAACSTLLLPDRGVLGQAANTEIFLILPATLGFLGVLYALRTKSRLVSFAAGFCLALAILCKQTAFLYLLFAGAILVLNPGTGMNVLVFFIGALIPFVLSTWYFSAKGGLSALLHCTILYNWQYSQASAWGDYWWNLWQWLTPHLRDFWIIDVLALSFFLRTVRALMAETRGWHRKADVLLVGWFIVSCIAVATGGYFRPHYFILLIPSLSLMAAWSIVVLPWRQLFPNVTIPYAAAVLLLAQALSLQKQWGYYFHPRLQDPTVDLYETTRFAEARTIADIIREKTSPNDTVFIFGHEPEILFYAKRASASRYIFLYPLLIPSRSALNRQHEVIDELRAAPPKVILTFFQPKEKELIGGPTYVFGALRQIISQLGYHVYALVGSENSEGYRFILGPEAAARWNKTPSWPDDWLAPYKVVLWVK